MQRMKTKTETNIYEEGEGVGARGSELEPNLFWSTKQQNARVREEEELLRPRSNAAYNLGQQVRWIYLKS